MARDTAIRKAIRRKLGDAIPSFEDARVEADFYKIAEGLQRSPRGLRVDDVSAMLELAKLYVQIVAIENDLIKNGLTIESSTKWGTARKANPGIRMLPGLRARVGVVESGLGLKTAASTALFQRERLRNEDDSGGAQEALDVYFEGGTPDDNLHDHTEWNPRGYWQAAPGWRYDAEARAWTEDAATADRPPWPPLPPSVRKSFDAVKAIKPFEPELAAALAKHRRISLEPFEFQNDTKEWRHARTGEVLKW